MGRRRYSFGEFDFDPETGELTPRGERPTVEPARLPPQPARLLTLLAEAGGDVVSREAIREAVWAGVQVDFDAGLHFCIRQIRTALGDSPQERKYIETLPRRGYRLVPEVTQSEVGPGDGAADPGAEDTGGADAPVAAWRLDRLVAGAVLLLVAVSAVFLAVRLTDSPADAAPHRPPGIAVMPFDPPADWGDPDPQIAAIAEGVLEILAAEGVDRVRVVGPSTTAGHDPDEGLVAFAETHDLDWVVNGRFLRDDDGPSMLAELIRATDGAHVWVKRYRQIEDGKAVAAEIGREVLARVR